jgi:DNA-binding response OmpR family regulator
MSEPSLFVRLGAWFEGDYRLACLTKTAPGVVFVDCKLRRIARDGVVITPAKAEFRVLAAMLSRRGGFISNQEMIDALYAGRADGGPDFADKSVWVYFSKVRGHLSRLGLARRREYTIGSCIESAPSYRQEAA